jgi:hypothetical protein
MPQNRSNKISRVSTVLISIALLLVTSFTSAMASSSSVKEVLSNSYEVPLRESVSDSSFDAIGWVV